MPVPVETKAKVPVTVAAAADEALVVSTIVSGFSVDPVARWVYPLALDYFSQCPKFAKVFGGKAFEHNSAHMTEGGFGAALWLPPDVSPDEEALGTMIMETARPEIRDDLLSVFDQMGSYHPHEPHWYLPMIGVDVAYQNRGYGSALLEYALRQCDQDQAIAYLESSNPRNISLYKRYGFEVIGTIQVGSSPEIYPMVRRPQRRSTR